MAVGLCEPCSAGDHEGHLESAQGLPGSKTSRSGDGIQVRDCAVLAPGGFLRRNKSGLSLSVLSFSSPAMFRRH